MTETKNVNVSCNFDLRFYVIAKRGNGSKEIVADDKITAWVKQISLLGVKVSIEKHCSVKYCMFFEKRLLSIFKIVL